MSTAYEKRMPVLRLPGALHGFCKRVREAYQEANAPFEVEVIIKYKDGKSKRFIEEFEVESTTTSIAA